MSHLADGRDLGGRRRAAYGLCDANRVGVSFGVNRESHGLGFAPQPVSVLYLVLGARVELATHGFSVRCSTTELPQHLG